MCCCVGDYAGFGASNGEVGGADVGIGGVCTSCPGRIKVYINGVETLTIK